MFPIIFRNRKTKQHHRDVANSFLRIGRLLQQGYPLEAAIIFMEPHVTVQTSSQFSYVLNLLKEGHPVYEAFQSIDIPTSIKALLYFYHYQGDIAEGFLHAGTLLRYREKIFGELNKLIRYPVALLFFCLVVFVLMYQFVLPHFQSYFSTMSESPSVITSIFLSFLNHLPYLFGGGILVLTLTCFYIIYQSNQLTHYEKIIRLLSLPILKRYVKLIITYFFSLQLGKLMTAGMSLQQALKQFELQNYLPFLQQESVQISHELHQGNSFKEIVRSKQYLKEELAFVIDNGQKTGYLGSDLEQYSDILFSELEETIQRLLHLIQPILFFVIGGFVFLLFLITMLPLFQMLGGV
ncbi:late competence protein [Halalkalibacter wakoensis JCM 9140]|uniref:Late competence protein n=1 Tax=Halalkalibacter wakoensis JCM 9140 TaxID=1236970 RepID=W4Q010_9BACI|nr:competence type IV pilus assembly protein ComGB [Halalkalibacter wakoensis]GAE25332.1 late competence protein [Halalkalibacter wakoensis JCM 9140]